jgi:hypothetical protein
MAVLYTTDILCEITWSYNKLYSKDPYEHQNSMRFTNNPHLLAALRSPQPKSGASEDEAASQQYGAGDDGRDAGRVQPLEALTA